MTFLSSCSSLICDPQFVVSLATIMVLILLSAFFSSSETGFTGASRPLIHMKAKEGNKSALLVGRLMGKMEKLIGSVLFANTLINILATSLATNLLIKHFGENGVLYATILMTISILFFGEIMPKMFAVHKPETMALVAARPLSIVIVLLSPITKLLTTLSRMAWRLFGVDMKKNVQLGGNIEELKGAIDLHQGPGLEVQEERAMLRSILDLTHTDVSEIMVHRKQVEMIDANLPLEEITKLALESPHTRIPLWKNDPDNVIGILHAKELFRVLKSSPNPFKKPKIDDIALKPWFVPETTSLHDQLQEFRERREHFSLVVDEYGSLMGIVTLEDILEEIVGEITDEHDKESVSNGIKVQTDGTIVVQGDATLRDLNRKFDWSLPDEEASTIAGLVIYESRQIPEVGQTFSLHSLRIEILKRQRNQITLLKITPKH